MGDGQKMRQEYLCSANNFIFFTKTHKEIWKKKGNKQQLLLYNFIYQKRVILSSVFIQYVERMDDSTLLLQQ